MLIEIMDKPLVDDLCHICGRWLNRTGDVVKIGIHMYTGKLVRMYELNYTGKLVRKFERTIGRNLGCAPAIFG